MTRALTTRRAVARAAALGPLLAPFRGALAAGTTSATTTTIGYPADVGVIYTGAHSHWLQPWRDMVATRSFAAFSRGIGLNSDPDYPQSLAMFAAAGFRHVRVSLFWGSATFGAQTFALGNSTNATTATFIQAAKAAGLRPLILAQAFDQVPCPNQQIEITVANAIAAADTVITVSTTAGLKVDYSGLTGWVLGVQSASINFVSSTNVMCASIVTAINGNQLTLSKPVGVEIPAGATLIMNTLQFKPWSQQGSTDYQATMNGWLASLGAISSFMQSVLGTAGASDLGFDLELWNETSFGSSFLDINNYYSQPIVPETYVNGIPAVIPDIVAQSAAYIAANPAQFAGVTVTDGFASVSSAQASSTEPARIGALSKHPYPSPLPYPASDPGFGGLDATGAATGFIPSYTIYTHEYFSTGINPFTLARDIALHSNDFGGTEHGQNARTVDGAVAPVGVWITETGTATATEGVTGAYDIAFLTAKGTLRTLFFNLGIGVERVYVFEGVGDTTSLALVPSSAPTTPTFVLLALQNSLFYMANGLAGERAGDQAGTLRPISYTVSFTEAAAPTTLWTGNDTTECPNFVQPSDYVLIPVQVTPTRMAFLHWFTALDMRNTMSDSAINLVIRGLGSATPTVSAYDPCGGGFVHAAVMSQTAIQLSVQTVASDRPFILVVDQG